jgi:putative flippase GtrA
MCKALHLDTLLVEQINSYGLKKAYASLMVPGSQPETHVCPPATARRAEAHRSRVFIEARRFVIVGFVNTAVDLAVLNSLIFLTHKGRNGLWFSLYKSISFLVAVANSYFINHSWTFDGRAGRKSLTQAGQFLVVSLFGALINVSSASYVATFAPPIRGMEGYWPSIAALAGTACGLASNFFGYKHIVFSARQSVQPDSWYLVILKARLDLSVNARSIFTRATFSPGARCFIRVTARVKPFKNVTQGKTVETLEM